MLMILYHYTVFVIPAGCSVVCPRPIEPLIGFCFCPGGQRLPLRLLAYRRRPLLSTAASWPDRLHHLTPLQGAVNWCHQPA